MTILDDLQVNIDQREADELTELDTLRQERASLQAEIRSMLDGIGATIQYVDYLEATASDTCSDMLFMVTPKGYERTNHTKRLWFHACRIDGVMEVRYGRNNSIVDASFIRNHLTDGDVWGLL